MILLVLNGSRFYDYSDNMELESKWLSGWLAKRAVNDGDCDDDNDNADLLESINNNGDDYDTTRATAVAKSLTLIISTTLILLLQASLNLFV